MQPICVGPNRKLPQKVDRPQLEFSGTLCPGDSTEEITIHRKPDCLDTQSPQPEKTVKIFCPFLGQTFGESHSVLSQVIEIQLWSFRLLNNAKW